MPPKAAKTPTTGPKVYNTPPDTPETVYDQYIIIALKEDPPVSTLSANQGFGNPRKSYRDILGFFPYLKMSPAARMKIGKFVLDEREGPREFSIFCRVETRIEEHRVSTLVADLNSRFAGLAFADRAKLKMTLIRNFGEKFLKDWSYTERDPIKGKILYTRWNQIGTRSKATEKLPQSGKNDTDDESTDSDDVFIKKKRGATKPISSSSCSSAGPTPKKDQPPKVVATMLDNPFFTTGSKTPVKKDISGGKKTGKVAVAAGKSPKEVAKPKDDKKPKKADSKKTGKAASARTSGKRKHVSESDSDSDSSVEYVGSEIICPSPTKKRLVTPKAEQMDTSTGKTPDADKASLSSEATVTNYEVPVVSEFTEATLITEDHFDAKMKNFQEQFVTSVSTSDAMKHLVRQQVEAVFLESIAPFMNDLKYEIKDAIKEEVGKVLSGQANVAKRAAVTKLLEETSAMKDAIADFSVEHAAIRVEIGKLREHEADFQSRSNGILARMLPFEYMGPAADIFFASHFVQENIIHFVKDELSNLTDKVNVNIAFAFTNAFFTRMALAHLVWKHPISEDQMMYYKRTVPEPVERIVKTIIIPYVQKEMELRNSNLVIVWKKIRKIISRRFTNSRTKMLEWAFKKTFTPEEGFEALFNVDNEFYLYNEHAVPPVAIDDQDAYIEKLTNSRKEAKTALLASQDDKWVDGATFPSSDKVFDGFRGKSYTRKVFSKYDAIKIIVAAAAAKKMDVTALTWDEISNVPDLKEVYADVLNDYKHSLDDLVREFPHDPDYMIKIKSNSSSEEQSTVHTPRKEQSRSSDDSSSNNDDDDEVEEVLTQQPKEEPKDSESRETTPPDATAELVGIAGASTTDPNDIKEQLAIERTIKKAAAKK